VDKAKKSAQNLTSQRPRFWHKEFTKEI